MPIGQNRVRPGKPVQAMIQKTFGQGARRHARRKSSPASILDFPDTRNTNKLGETRTTVEVRGKRIKTPPATTQQRPNNRNQQPAKKVAKGKKSVVDRVLGKVGIRRKKQR